MNEVQRRLEFAVTLAEQAGRTTLEFFQTDRLDVERKGDDSPVTQADRLVEKQMREAIASSFPQDGLIGEEWGTQEGPSPFCWVLDPIDGTKSFIAGVPLYSVLIGVLCEGEAQIGVIHIPALAEMVYAARGGGTFWKRGVSPPRPARVSSRQLKDGTFITSQVDTFAERQALAAFHRLEKAAYITRTWGDGYGYLLVATGRAEVIVDPVMNLWDAAPLQPVLEGAGGNFTDWQGQACVDHGEGVGCSRHVQAEVLAITRDYPQPV